MTATLCIPYGAILEYQNDIFIDKSSSRAISTDANQPQKQVSEIYVNLHDNVIFGEPFYNAIDALMNLLDECCSDNWDGYGAKPINTFSFNQALQFIRTLPITLPSPELSIEPDGEIALEWYVAPRKTFSVSIGKNILTYAGLFGSNKTHGTEYFENEIPKTIIDNVQRVFS